MRVTQVVPPTAAVFDVESPAGKARLAELYDPGTAPFVRLNMITSVTGSAVGDDGTSNTLTSPTDRALLGIIRRQADAVVVGAATVRAEGYLLPRTARLGVVTETGDLTGSDLTGAGDRVLLVCPAERADAVLRRAALPDARVLALPGAELDPAAIVAALRAVDLPRIVCEGGPTLAARFAGAGVVDEYCVTVAPALSPAARSFLPVEDAVATEVAGALGDEAGFSYLRLRPRSSGPDAAATR